LHFANIAVFTVALYAAIAALMRASCRPESVLISWAQREVTDAQWGLLVAVRWGGGDR
jgi:hypothetical protein